jgi:branched-subunit amino acid aminotransferase/4-amino-4-deoxychorismate lyase
MRQVVVSKLCPATGNSAFEAEILRMDDFCELFITNSLIGIVPVIAVDNQAFAIGPVTRSLQQALKESRLLP